MPGASGIQQEMLFLGFEDGAYPENSHIVCAIKSGILFKRLWFFAFFKIYFYIYIYFLLSCFKMLAVTLVLV